MSFLKRHVLLILIVLAFIPILSYRLLQVPMGFSSDEAAFGYNATLLSRTLHDENDRFLPIFVLSLNGRDWRQPITQYYQTVFFKIFGASAYNLRFSSIVLTLATAILLYILVQFLFQNIYLSALSALCFLTVPIVFIQSHYGLDNNMTVPFTILWALGLLGFTKNKKVSWLVLSALSLGISFYTYKGMRAVVPVWSILSVLYLLKKSSFSWALKWSLFILPFFLIIPYLEAHYPGAVFNGQSAHAMSYYDFFYPYISTFDPGFLFITGDSTPFHSTGHHGMFLLATLPLFLIGIYASLKKKSNHIFILLAFFSAPALMGFVDSVHRASRTMCLVPFFVIITITGLDYLWHSGFRFSKLLTTILLVLTVLNFVNFYNYYHYDYGKRTQEFFGRLDYYACFEKLKSESKKYNLIPAVAQSYMDGAGDTGKFYEAIYFTQPVFHLGPEEDLTADQIILSHRSQVDGLTKVAEINDCYFLKK